ncbi:hypothetical protein BSPWISOXPB_3111 [uncultured Gammaproteobacteria bacterium]|nr:hypothetical protein BSPWISOXPB_3111 [uncultured Gammaproteobacteria bacterium]
MGNDYFRDFYGDNKLFCCTKICQNRMAMENSFANICYSLIAVMFSIIDYHFSLSLYTSLLLKSLLVFSYIVVGYITNLMSIKKIKELIFVKV